jgi:hypothetical protein
MFAPAEKSAITFSLASTPVRTRRPSSCRLLQSRLSAPPGPARAAQPLPWNGARVAMLTGGTTKMSLVTTAVPPRLRSSMGALPLGPKGAPEKSWACWGARAQQERAQSS